MARSSTVPPSQEQVNASTKLTFGLLLKALNEALGPSSGLDAADVDLDTLKDLMDGYNSNVDDWIRYAHRDPSSTYTRNLVNKGNGKSNLVRIVAIENFT